MKEGPKKTDTQRLLEQVEAFSKGDLSDAEKFRQILPEVLENFKNSLEELAVAEEELRQQNEELREVQSELKAQRKDYEDLFELAPVGYLITDEKGIVKDANRAAHQMLDISRLIDVAVPLANVILAAEKKQFRAELERLRSSNGLQQWEQTLIAKGRLFPALVRAILLEGLAEKKRILWIIQDITERKQREVDRENARLFAEQLFQTIREPLLVLTEDLHVMLANPSFYRTFRVKPEATIGAFVYNLGNNQWDIPALRGLLEEVISGRDFFQDFQVEHEFPDIGRRIMLLNARRLYNPILGRMVLLAIQDVTERIDAKKDLESLTEKLQNSNQELENFAYVASHDLQEPLRMVASYVQLLERRYRDKLDSDGQEFMDYAVDGATRMKALIESLLLYSRVQTRAKELEPIDSEEVLQKVLLSLHPLIAENEAEITHDSLPEVMADKNQLGLVFQNLIENGIKFRKEDQPPKIHISAAEEDEYVKFSVSDNGIGIEERYHERIFRMFQRLHTRTERSGTGIGLAICKRIVERHGGRIWLEPALGQGTTFYFTIPRRTQ
jgi:PAS domain S-box-containing protein